MKNDFYNKIHDQTTLQDQTTLSVKPRKMTENEDDEFRPKVIAYRIIKFNEIKNVIYRM